MKTNPDVPHLEGPPQPVGDGTTVFLVSPIRTADPWKNLSLSSDLRSAGLSFVRVNYGYENFPFRFHMESAVESLVKAVSEHRGQNNVIISLGVAGIIVKKCLLQLHANNDPFMNRLSLIAFVAAPHRSLPGLFFGIERFKFLPIIGRLIRGKSLQLSLLESEWVRFVRSTNIRTVHIVGDMDEFAPYSASDQWDSRNVYLIRGSHASLVKGTSMEEKNSILSQIITDILLEQVLSN